MSLAAHLLNEAALAAAGEAARRVGVLDWKAAKLAPIALSMVMHGLRRRTRSLLGAAALSIVLERHPEDLLRNPRRLSAADVRARGQALVDRTLGASQSRAARALADLAAIDLMQATEILAMTAAAALSALAKSRRDLRLNALELRGVIKSESAAIDDADPALVLQVRDWVFRPAWPQRAWTNAQSALRRASRTRIIVPAE